MTTKKWRVHLDAYAAETQDETIEASTAEEALEKATADAHMSGCHQCPEIGEIYAVFVENVDDHTENASWSDADDDARTIRSLQAEIAELKAEIERLKS